jgi:hypothetical protein
MNLKVSDMDINIVVKERKGILESEMRNLGRDCERNKANLINCLNKTLSLYQTHNFYNNIRTSISIQFIHSSTFVSLYQTHNFHICIIIPNT